MWDKKLMAYGHVARTLTRMNRLRCSLMCSDAFDKKTLQILGAISAMMLMGPVTAHAQDMSLLTNLIPDKTTTSGVVLFALFTGAFSFAMMSATWLIRERRRLERDHKALALEHADLRSRHERAQALLDVPDQRVVIWSGWDEQPICRGTLPSNIGAPEDRSGFVAFGTWMTPLTAQPFEHAVERLRKSAEGFDLTVETRTGMMVEVQGRASGSHAFVRFIGLSGDRAALASLENAHTQLLNETDTMKTLLEQIPAPVWLRDKDDQISWANPAYLDAVEAGSLDEVCENAIELLDASNRDQIAKSHASDSTSNFSHFHERIPATISGDRRAMDVHEVSYAGGSAGMAVDMSEVEEVQDRLRRTLESHAQTVDQLATAVAMFDENRRLVFHNQAFQSLWKLDEGFLQSEPDNGAILDQLRADGLLAEQPDWSKWRNGLFEVYSATQPQEHWWHLPDGSTLRVVANPHKQGGVTWVFENITEQLEMESRYIALTQVQGETLDHLNESIAVFGSDGRLKLSNPSFQNLWQLTDEQVAAETPIGDIVSHCEGATVEAELWEPLITGVTGISDARNAHSGRMTAKSGASLDYALVPLPNGQNMISFVDVSASVQMEAALTERNEALEAAEQLKNAFIEHVSYEFRAPLTNIIGFADMLREEVYGPINAKQREYLDHISSSSNVLHSMVDNMLDLATVDAGIMELDLDTVDLRSTVQGAVKSVAEHLKEQGVKLHLALPPKPQKLVADATRVQQVLFNLLTNAVRFSPEGSEIRLECEADSQNVTMRVSDAGPGIPKDKQATIFERFEAKAHAGGSRGAGLGLAIARSLVELHGGTIALDTDVKTGASFVCTFPRTPQIQVAAAE